VLNGSALAQSTGGGLAERPAEPTDLGPDGEDVVTGYRVPRQGLTNFLASAEYAQSPCSLLYKKSLGGLPRLKGCSNDSAHLYAL
jgi:hypothetical protein